MRKLILLLWLALPLPAFAQSILTISPQHCVWRAGDDPAWAAPTLDESAWQSNPHWQGLSPAAHIWVRCHTDLSSLQSEKQPALQVTLYGAYQLFLNGEPLGGAGNIHSGVFSMNVIRQYPIEKKSISETSGTLALRITYRVSGALSTTREFNMDPPIIYAGDSHALDAQRAQVIWTDSSKLLGNAFGYSLIGALGVALLGLFYYDRIRLDLLYLSVSCQVMALARINGFGAADQMNYSSILYFALRAVCNTLGPLVWILFFFALTRRRVSRFFWLAFAIIFVRYLVNIVTLFLPVEQALWLFRSTEHIYQPLGLGTVASVAISMAPFVAFWPYSRISGYMRPLAALCLLWGVADLTIFIAALKIWRFELLEVRGVVAAWVLVSLLALLFRDQHRVTEERALLAGEMQAASEIQRMLAPASLDCAPGLKIDVAFHPMREVGGDFYHCRVLPAGTQRVVIGDVSGKGSAAAMTATLLIGAAAARDTDSPAILLSKLNQVLIEYQVGGFATCLCADIAADGTVTMANAGHLAPYFGGDEFKTESALPLGVASNATYAQTTFPLSPGETVTFLSDGVVEAQSPAGELFGFERTRAISNQTAEEIATTAKRFGQQDDITVLTLNRLPASEEFSTELSVSALTPAEATI